MADKEKIRKEIESEEQVKESAETQHVNETCKESDNSLTQEDAMTIRKEWFEHCKKSWYNEGYVDGKYNRDRQFEEPVSEDLEEEIKRYLHKVYDRDTTVSDVARHFAQWQKEQMIAKAIDAHCFGFQGDALFSFTLPADNYLVGSKVKVIIYK